MSNKTLYNLGFIISIPFFLWAILLILPTFDDWTTLSLPNYDPNYLLYVLPLGMTWRPGDAIFGYINAIDYHLYPTLNHIMIFLAHIGSTIVIFKLTKLLNFKDIARYIASIFFYISPCILGTILSCDALNQSYSHLWGILSVYLYLTQIGKKKYIGWLGCTLLATFAKDNGLAWAIVPPIIAFAFNKIDKHTFKRDITIGLAWALLYAIVRLSVPSTYVKNGSYEEDVVSLHSRIKGLASWISYTWVAADYIAIIHQPSRNMILAFSTTLLSCIFMASIWWNKKVLKSRQLLLLIMTLFIVASPHLLISMSIMNTYSSLGIAALIIGYLANEFQGSNQKLQILFILYILAAIITDVHHWYKAWQTSLPGKEIAKSLIKKTGKPVNKVYCIMIEDDSPKFSSFCVPTNEAIGWGRSVWQITGYKWPQELKDTTLKRTQTAMKEARKIAHMARKNHYDCAWIVNKSQVEVVK